MFRKFKKVFRSLVFFIFVATLLTTSSFVAVDPVNADPNVRHEWYGTHHFFDSNGNYCYTDNRFTTTEEEWYHPEDTPREVPVGTWVRDENGKPVYHIYRYKTVYEHTYHNMTTNIHRGTWHHHLSGPCN